MTAKKPNQPTRRVARKVADAATPSSATEATTPTQTLTPAARAAKRRLDSGGGGRRGAVAEFAPLDPDDASIPFDRVPYVPGDLRRVLLMATLMILIIIVAAIVVPRLIA